LTGFSRLAPCRIDVELTEYTAKNGA